MKLFIVRHAIAEERGKKIYPNDDRPLTTSGIRKMQQNAEAIAQLVDSPVNIISSPLKRAYHTSEILASKLKTASIISQSEALLPETTVENIIRLCIQHAANEITMIVGHEPSLGKFISAILRYNGELFSLKKGSICIVTFNKQHPKNSELLLYMPPKVLRTFAR